MRGKGRGITPEDMAIGAKIHEARLAADLTQEQLSEKIGLSRQQICKYECGEDRISAGRLKAIARALNVKIIFFFDDIAEIIKQPMKQALTLQAAQYFGKIKSTAKQKEALLYLKTINIEEI